MASTGAVQGRGLPRFLPLVRTVLLDSIRLLDDLWQQKASLSRLMVTTQQVEGKDDMRAIQQAGLDMGLTCRKRDIEPTTESTVTVGPKRTD
jgi:hypothetical protein